MNRHASTAPDPDRDGKLLADPDVLDVLRTAAGAGYVLIGPHHRIGRRAPDRYGHRGNPGHVLDIGHAERDSVQRLATAGLLHLDGAETVVDGGQTRSGYPFHLTRTGAIALHSWSLR